MAGLPSRVTVRGVDADRLTEMVQFLAANQAQRQQQLAQLDQMEALLSTLFAQQSGLDPIVLKVIQTLAVIRAADQTSANAVHELTKMVDERRHQQG